MTGTVLFDTDAMIRVGKQLRGYHHVTDPLAGSIGRVPAGLPPSMGDVEAQCRYLELGVRSIGQMVQELGEFAADLGTRVRDADAHGDRDIAIALARFALFHMSTATATVAARQQLARLKAVWPDVVGSINDIRGAKALDDLLHGLGIDDLRKLDALAAWRRVHPYVPPPPELRAINRALRQPGQLAPYLRWGGIAGSVIVQALSDLHRDDLSLEQKVQRAARAGAIDMATGKAAAAGLRLLVTRLPMLAVEGGPPAWLLAGAVVAVTAVAGDQIGGIISSGIDAVDHPNAMNRMHLPPEIRARIEAEGRGPYQWPQVTHPTPEMRHLLSDAHAQEQRISDLYRRLHVRTPVLDPVDYGHLADDLIHELDDRNVIAERLERLQRASS